MIPLTNGIGQTFWIRASEIMVIRPCLEGEYGNDKLISVVEVGGKNYGCQESIQSIIREWRREE